MQSEELGAHKALRTIEVAYTAKAKACQESQGEVGQGKSATQRRAPRQFSRALPSPDAFLPRQSLSLQTHYFGTFYSVDLGPTVRRISK